MELIPSMLMESWVGKVPATEMFHLGVGLHPRLRGQVDMALVDP